METKTGLLTEKICLVKKDDMLIEDIIKARKITSDTEIERLRRAFYYNVITTNLMAQITGLDRSTIANKTRPIVKNGEVITELDFTYPCPDLANDGPKFIVRNKKFYELLKKCI